MGKIIRIGVVVGALLIFGLLPGAMVWLMTRGGTRPMDRRLTDTPATYGAVYEEVSFPSTDGLRLSGWYLPGRDAQLCVILCHGRFRSRREVLRQAVALWHLGHSALLFDFRHHGQSEGRFSSFGYEERKDVEGAVRYLREERKSAAHIAVFGISMGSAAALLAAAETPAIEAIIVDSTFRSLRDTVAHHIRVFLHLPSFPLTDEILFLMSVMTGVDSQSFNLEAAVQKIGRRPILFIVGAADRRMPPAIAEDLYRQAQSFNKALLIVPRATHGHAYQTDPSRYVATLQEFLSTAFADQHRKPVGN